MADLFQRILGANTTPAAKRRLEEQARREAEWEQEYNQKIRGLEQPAFDPADIMAGGLMAAPRGIASMLGGMGLDAATGMAMDTLPSDSLFASVVNPKVAQVAARKAAKRFLQPEVNVGFGTIKTKPIGGDLYRETDAEGVGDMLTGLFARTPERGKASSMFMSDDPTLAIGQFGNKGVKMRFNGDFVSGAEHIKPGTGVVGGREFKSDFIGRDALEEFTLPKGAKLRGSARVFAKQNFDREVLPNGDRIFRRKSE
jgi:hypothetical protein